MFNLIIESIRLRALSSRYLKLKSNIDHFYPHLYKLDKGISELHKELIWLGDLSQSLRNKMQDLETKRQYFRNLSFVSNYLFASKSNRQNYLRKKRAYYHTLQGTISLIQMAPLHIMGMIEIFHDRLKEAQSEETHVHSRISSLLDILLNLLPMGPFRQLFSHGFLKQSTPSMPTQLIRFELEYCTILIKHHFFNNTLKQCSLKERILAKEALTHLVRENYLPALCHYAFLLDQELHYIRSYQFYLKAARFNYLPAMGAVTHYYVRYIESLMGQNQSPYHSLFDTKEKNQEAMDIMSKAISYHHPDAIQKHQTLKDLYDEANYGLRRDAEIAVHLSHTIDSLEQVILQLIGSTHRAYHLEVLHRSILNVEPKNYWEKKSDIIEDILSKLFPNDAIAIRLPDILNKLEQVIEHRFELSELNLQQTRMMQWKTKLGDILEILEKCSFGDSPPRISELKTKPFAVAKLRKKIIHRQQGIFSVLKRIMHIHSYDQYTPDSTSSKE